jgi:hypothetical protein
MKMFTMSMYRNKEDLYKAKAEYWEKMFDALLTTYGYDTIGCNLDEEDKEKIIDQIEGDMEEKDSNLII